MKWIVNILLILICLSCDDFEQVVEIELPPVENQLMVECYLEKGQPYRVLLTETKSYFDDLDACPFVRDAVVVIKHGNTVDTLNECFYFNDNCDPNDIIPYGFIPFLSPDSTRFFNYGSNTLCPSTSSDDFTLEIHHPSTDRFVTATARFKEAKTIDIFETQFNDEDKAYCLMGLVDDPTTTDYFRYTLHKRSLTKRQGQGAFSLPVARNPQFDIVLDDKSVTTTNELIVGTNFRYEEGDTLIGTIYTIDKLFHDYLEITRDAIQANGSPFAQPAVVISNITGGYGIFTALSYHRDTIEVQR